MTRTLVAGVDTSTQSCKVRVTDAETGEMVRFGQAKHLTTLRHLPSAVSSTAW